MRLFYQYGGYIIVFLLTVIGFFSTVETITYKFFFSSFLILILFNGIIFSSILIQNRILLPRLLKTKNWRLFIFFEFLLLVGATLLTSQILYYIDLNHFQISYENISIFEIYLLTPWDSINLLFKTVPTQLLFMILFGAAAAVQLAIQSERNSTRSYISQLESRQKLLVAQINPHFLFNVLNSIYALVLKKSDEAPAAILKLSDLLRYTLYQSNFEKISIAQEFKIINMYLTLEELRWQEKHSIIINTVNLNMDYHIAPMLLFPIVENAVKHGLNAYNTENELVIQCSNNNNIFYFTCTNFFMPDNIVNHNGLGLKNVAERLQLLYPNRHKLEINKNEHKFSVTIIINP